jgi:hypothetical protein
VCLAFTGVRVLVEDHDLHVCVWREMKGGEFVVLVRVDPVACAFPCHEGLEISPIRLLGLLLKKVDPIRSRSSFPQPGSETPLRFRY